METLSEDLLRMMILILCYPYFHFTLDGKKKVGGHNVKSIVVRRNPVYNNKNFALVLDDDTVVDISFIECVTRKGLKEEIKSACSEVIEDIKKPDIDLNNVIKEWLKGFDNGDLSVGIYLDNNHFNNQDLINNFRNFYVQTN